MWVFLQNQEPQIQQVWLIWEVTFLLTSDVSVVSQVPPLQIKKIMADLCRVYCRSVVKSKKAMRSPLCPLDGYKVGSVSLVCCCPFFDRGRCDWFWYLMDKVGGFTKHRWICCFPNVHFCLWRITLFLSFFLGVVVDELEPMYFRRIAWGF